MGKSIEQINLVERYSEYSRNAHHNLVADYSLDQSVLVIDTHNDLE